MDCRGDASTNSVESNVALLEEMDELFPPLSISPADTTEQIMYKAGQRSVVEWFQERIKEET